MAATADRTIQLNRSKCLASCNLRAKVGLGNHCFSMAVSINPVRSARNHPLAGPQWNYELAKMAIGWS
jgi:hypothetical protein